MKKLILLIVVVLTGLKLTAQQPPTPDMYVVDHPGFIFIGDSNAVGDNTYAPIIIPKNASLYIKTRDKRGSSNGNLQLFINNMNISESSTPDFELNSRYFDEFDSNDQLRQWLYTAHTKEYHKKFNYDGSSNLIDIQSWIITNYDTAMSYHDTIKYSGSNIDSTWTKY